MKIILVLLDGLGDRAYDLLGHKTPMQAAYTPNIDKIASLGSNGLFHAATIGQCLPSEIAHYLLFGYGLESFPGRGLLEAVGAGVPFEDDDVLAMAHLSAVKWEGNSASLVHGPEVFHADVHDIDILYDLLHSMTPFEQHGVSIRIHKKKGRNDAVLVLSGGASPYISDSDPIIPGRAIARIVPIQGCKEYKQAQRTAQSLNVFLSYCASTLKNHPINTKRYENFFPAPNFLVTQRCGRRIKQETFADRYAMRGMIIASGGIYKGIAHELSMTFQEKNDGGNPGHDLRERIQLALNDTEHNFIHVHTKAPDVAAHSGSPFRKKEVLTSLDQGLDILIDTLARRKDVLVAVTADHSTPSISDQLIHSGEQVPLTIVGDRVRRDDVQLFDEISAAQGCLGTLRGEELMLMLLNYSDRSSFIGHQLGPVVKASVPNTYEPFTLDGDCEG